MSENKKLAVMVAADVIGTGDEELGHNLMKSYIYSLTEADEKPETMMFLNKGVYLTTTGSPVLDMIKQLEADGVEILSCGACLDFYKLNDALEAGAVTNMYSNVEIMHEADNTIVISQVAGVKEARLENSFFAMAFSCTTDTIETEKTMQKKFKTMIIPTPREEELIDSAKHLDVPHALYLLSEKDACGARTAHLIEETI